jgi:hypothetical protein
MKPKPFFNAVRAALMAVIFSVLAACATGGGGGAAGGAAAADPAAAARLAAERNALTAGSAKAGGGTVTLSGEVWLETALTVPAGVTLDLTAEGAALKLQDGVVLTVDGTVNARGHGDHGKGWVEGSLHIEDGAAAINGNGTIRLAGRGRLLHVWGGNGRTLTLEGVTLAGLPDNDASLVGVGGGGTLVMKSGAITGNTRIDDDWADGGGVEIGEGGAFTMEGGAISGNSAQGGRGGNGGGVRVWKGKFTMKSGVISGNTGGGVNLGESSVFTMEGGTISGNTRPTSGSASVCVWDGSTFTMKGGAITGNNARGVFTNAERGTSHFIMEGGEISGNNGSGAVIHTGSKFTMSGGAIYGNTSWEEGGGVLILGDSFFTMMGGRIQGGTDSDGFTKNTARQGKDSGAALWLIMSTAKWGTGGAYTRGGASQTGGSDIVPVGDEVGTNDTLIAIPAR